MGRGRQKAKDAKIARQLKYTNHGSDIRDLERELVSHEPSAVTTQDQQHRDRWDEDDDD